jgi:hypothetical protein
MDRADGQLVEDALLRRDVEQHAAGNVHGALDRQQHLPCSAPTQQSTRACATAARRLRARLVASVSFCALPACFGSAVNRADDAPCQPLPR